MKKLILAASVAVIGITALLVLSTSSAQAAPNDCKVDVVGTQNTANGPNSKFTKDGTKVTAKVKVTGNNCDVPVSLVSWEAPNAEARPLSAQKLYKVTKANFNTGTHAISVQVPECYFQVDLIRGHQVGGPNGAPQYGPEINMGWILGGQKKCEEPSVPKEPRFNCNLLKITADTNRMVTVSDFKTTGVNGAKFKNAVVKWGDGKSTAPVTNVKGQKHQFAADGTYIISATARYTYKDANGNQKEGTDTSKACSKKVTFKAGQPPVITEPPVTPITPATVTPKVLPNTGPGSAIAILGAASTTIGGAAHAFIMRRRILG